MAIKLMVLGGMIVATFYLLRGHDVLTGMALVALFLVALAKVVSAILFRRRNPPFGESGGGHPPDAPVPRPPGGRPPVLSAAVDSKLNH